MIRAGSRVSSIKLSSVFTLTMAILIILSLSIVGALQANRMFASQQEAVFNQLSINALAAAQQLDRFILSNSSNLEVAIQFSRQSLSSSDESQRLDAITTLMRLLPSVQKITLINGDGMAMSKVSRSQKFSNDQLVSLSDTELWKNLRNGRHSQDVVQFDASSGQPAIVLSLPMLDETGNLLGGLIAEIEPTYITDLLASLNVDKQGLFYLINNAGRLISSSDMTILKPGEQINKPGLEELLDLKNHHQGYISDKSGDRSMAATALIASTGWYFVEELASDVAFQTVVDDLLITIAIVIIFLLLSVVIGSVLAKRLSKPLEQLGKAAQLVADGNSTYRIESEQVNDCGFQEVQQLMGAFNKMIEQVQSRNFALKQSEETARKTAKRLAAHVQNSPLGVIEWDTNFRVMEWNSAAEKIFGYSREQALGNHARDLIIKNVDQETIDNVWNQLLAQQSGHININENNTHDGEIRVCEWYNTVLTDTEGTVVGVASLVDDITERKLAEQMLVESEERFRSLFDQSFQFALVMDAHGTILDINEPIRQIYGERSKESIGSPIWDAPWWSDIEGVGEQTKAVLSRVINGEVVSDEAFFQDKQGKLHTAVRMFSPISDETGKINVISLVGLDITERKKTEESLRITQFSFDKAAVGIYRLSADGKIIEVNNNAAEMLGYSIDEMLSLSIFDIDPLVNSASFGQIWQSLRDNKHDMFETIHRRKDGTELSVEIRSNLFEYGGKEYSIAFSTDITDKLRAEGELRSLRNYLSNVIDSMPSSLVGVDKEGNITQWNKTMASHTGVSAEKAQGQSLTELLPWMTSEMDKIRKSIRSRQVILNPHQPRQLDDGMRYEDVTIYPLVTNGVEGAVIRIDDVTEKVRLEEIMVQSEKMLSVGGLAAGMAHEINNPLAGMMQTAQVMSNRLRDSSHIKANQQAAMAAGTNMDAIQQFMQARGIVRMLDAITDSGKRVTEIVDNMLSFARKSDALISSHLLDEVIDKTLELASTDYDLKKQYDFKLIEITRDYAPGLPSIPCEGAKLQQVLLNLLRNASQAMQSAGVEYPHITLRTHYDDKHERVCLEVEDNGPGMDEDTRKRVFEPFFTTKPVGVGTGLGLSVSYFIVTENHQGNMVVESQPGEGAKFTLCLPIQRR